MSSAVGGAGEVAGQARQHLAAMPGMAAGKAPPPAQQQQHQGGGQGGAAGTGAPPAQGSGEKGGDSNKDGQTPYNGWAAAMEAYYKSAPPGHAHPGSYYGSPMPTPYHPHMWGPQPMMAAYGAPPPSPYAYGAMYPTQLPTMSGHPPPPSPYSYPSTPSAPSKEATETANVSAPAVTTAAPAAAPLTGGAAPHDGSATDASSGSAGGQAPVKGGMRRNKRSYETLTSSEGGRPSMASPPTGSGAATYAYTPDMWVGPHVSRSQSSGGLNTDGPTMPFQDEREVKRQRRKQSNRESARRSRLRKQAECEDLSTRVHTLVTDNTALRTELAQLQERCSLLSSQNAMLQEKARAAGISLPVQLSGGKQEGGKEGKGAAGGAQGQSWSRGGGDSAERLQKRAEAEAADPSKEGSAPPSMAGEASAEWPKSQEGTAVAASA